MILLILVVQKYSVHRYKWVILKLQNLEYLALDLIQIVFPECLILQEWKKKMLGVGRQGVKNGKTLSQ